MTDDLSVYNSSALHRQAAKAGLTLLYNQQPKLRKCVANTKHCAGANDHDGHAISFMAEVVYAGRHCEYIIGQGSSGVAQLVALQIGARKAMLPDYFGVWVEDVYLSSRFPGAEQQKVLNQEGMLVGKTKPKWMLNATVALLRHKRNNQRNDRHHIFNTRVLKQLQLPSMLDSFYEKRKSSDAPEH
jgi:hypothetical protein